MGAFVRLLSLGFSISFTAAAHGRRRLTPPPPHPFGLSLLLLVLLALCGSAQAATPPYLTNYGYTNTWVWGPNQTTNYLGEVVDVDTQTNFVAVSYTRGSGAYLQSGWDEVHDYYTQYYDPGTSSYEWAWFNDYWYRRITHTWGWSGGGLDAGSTHDVQALESTWPDASNSTITDRTPADYAFPLPTAGVHGSWTTVDGSGGQSTESGSSTMKFNTEGPLGSTTNRLWRLKLDLWLTNPDFPWGFQIPLFQTGVVIAGRTIDTNGCVFVMLPDNTEVDVTPGGVTFPFYYFTVQATPVELTGIEWWNPATTNWSSSDPVYVLTNTTVIFRAQANVPDVRWPYNALTWTLNGQEYSWMTPMSGQPEPDYGLFPHFFTEDDLCATDTNFHFVTVSHATVAFTNKVMVAGMELRAIPVDTNVPNRVPFRFGVGEIINIVPEFTPNLGASIPLLWTNWSSFDWSQRDPEDRAKFETSSVPTQYKAGSDPETATIFAVVNDGPSFLQPRALSLTIVAPTNVVLRQFRLINAADATWYLVNNTNIYHQTNRMSAAKRVSIFIQPDNVSFTRIRMREGVGTYLFNGVAQTNVPGTAFNSDGTWFSANKTFGPTSHAESAEFYEIVHARPGPEPGYPNVLVPPDTFGVGDLTTTDSATTLEYPFVPAFSVVRTIEIDLQYKFNVWTNTSFGKVPSKVIISPDKNIDIRKDSLPQAPDSYFRANFTNRSVFFH